MPDNIIGGWRGVSLLTQADIASAKAVNTLIPFTGDPLEPQAANVYRNTDQVTGGYFATRRKILNFKFEGKHKDKLTPHLAGLFASMAMGKAAVAPIATTTAFRHTFRIASAADLPSGQLPFRTLIENDGAKQFRNPGLACRGFMISGGRDQFCEFEADLIGRGDEVDETTPGPPTAKPPQVLESYMTYADVNLRKGSVWDDVGETITTAGTLVSADLVDFKFEFKSNAQGQYLCGDGSRLVGRVNRGRNYEATLEATLEISDRTYRTELRTDTYFGLHLPIEGEVANGAAKYLVELILPRVALEEAPKKVSDSGALIISAKFGVLDYFVMRIQNLYSANYLANA